MFSKRIFVIDTNILIDYPDIIPNKHVVELEEQTVDLSQAHIVIPTAVTRELSSFKKESSERGKVSRKVLKRLRDIFETEDLELIETYRLEAPVKIGDQEFSVLPVHKNFTQSLPFEPTLDDMDGQIILAALAVQCILKGKQIDGTDSPRTNFLSPHTPDIKIPRDKVTLLTNDNGLAIRANVRGVATSRYGYKLPAPYTGRRNVAVSEDTLRYFQSNHGIELDIWQMMESDEEGREMVANEFIIMSLKDAEKQQYAEVTEDMDKDWFFRHIGRFDVEKQMIVPLDHLKEFPERVMNAGQAIYAEALMNPKFSAVICTGPAGSGKTYMAAVYGYYACKAGKYTGVTVVPCASQSRIGALPGDLNDKMDPDVQPLKNALRNFLLKNDRGFKKELDYVHAHGMKEPTPKDPNNSEAPQEDNRSLSQKLRDRVNAIWDAWFSNLPIESARGRDFSFEIALYDEFQDQNATQADTLLKRLGDEGKIVLTGDVEQVHAPYLDSENNGLVYATQQLYDDPEVVMVHFTEDEVVRHPLVKRIAERQKKKGT